MLLTQGDTQGKGAWPSQGIRALGAEGLAPHPFLQCLSSAMCGGAQMDPASPEVSKELQRAVSGDTGFFLSLEIKARLLFSPGNSRMLFLAFY